MPLGKTPGSRRIAALTIIAISLFGCVGDGDPPEPGAALPDDGVERTAAGLNGFITFPDSSCGAASPQDPRRRLIVDAGVVALSHINSNAMALCLREHYLSNARDRSVEEILARMRQNMPTQVWCADLGGSSGSAPGNTTDERITLDNALLQGNTAAGVARVLLHEVAHNKGFGHGSNANGSAHYHFTVNEQLLSCSFAISTFRFVDGYPTLNVPAATGASRAELSRATFLSPAGGLGGTPTSLACGSTRFARGLTGGTDGRVVRTGFVCADATGRGIVGNTGTAGGTGGTAFTEDCGAGELMVGVQGRADFFVNRIGPICLPVSQIAAGTAAPRSLPQHGGTNGRDFFRQCPPRMAVRRFYARTSSVIERLTFECEDINEGVIRPSAFVPTTYGSTAANPTTFRENCPTGSILSAVSGRGGAEVDLLASVCRPLDTVDDFAAPEIGLEARGNFDGGTGSDDDHCPLRQGVIGLQIRSGARIDGVRAICADVTDWMDLSIPASSIPETLTEHIGGTGGGQTIMRCPRGELVGGWDVGTAFTPQYNAFTVHTLRPICVDPRP